MTFSLAVWIALAALAQGPVPPVAGAHSVGETREWTTAEDHRNMMEQLAIKALRPGPSGNEQAPNHANYDEALANPFPKLPDVLTLNNGRKVGSTEEWRTERRPEIVEDFEREGVGRIPKNVPNVTWSVTETANAQVAGHPVVGKRLAGHVDNASYPGDLPVDAHELIALCAPRPTFISYGVPERGDAKWLDHKGRFMAAVAAGPVFRLLGVKDLGTSDDYRTEKMPPVNVGLLDGPLAWRQHDGGHTDGPNWKYFIPWADKLLNHTRPLRTADARAAAPEQPAQVVGPADQPAPRTDQNSMTAHAALVKKATTGRIDVYFVGDSITRRWGALDYPELLANWRSNFFGWNAANFGWGADRIQNILWRLENGELDGVRPKIIVVLAGTNNVGSEPGGDEKIANITRGLKAIVDVCRHKAPNATIILTAIFPRNDNMAVLPEIDRINTYLADLADGRKIRFINVNDQLADQDGRLFEGMTGDTLHPTLKGYQIWADALKPIFLELLGPPAAIDLAPPPTGDPGARHRVIR
jgi:lysophospholipase L1-like esterase